MWVTIISILIITSFIILFPFVILSMVSQIPSGVYNVIFWFMIVDLVAMIYYVIYISRVKLGGKDTKEELETRLKLIELGKKRGEEEIL